MDRHKIPKAELLVFPDSEHLRKESVRVVAFVGMAMGEFFFCGFLDADDLNSKIQGHTGEGMIQIDGLFRVSRAPNFLLPLHPPEALRAMVCVPMPPAAG